jgi:hypothetical protein
MARFEAKVHTEILAKVEHTSLMFILSSPLHMLTVTVTVTACSGRATITNRREHESHPSIHRHHRRDVLHPHGALHSQVALRVRIEVS